MRVYQEPAFVLHLRPYRETSALVELFTSNNGRVSVVARGIRSMKSRNLLQPFAQLQISYTGRSQLKTLTGTEVTALHWLQGIGLYSGLYLNELLIRFMGIEDPHPLLFRGYRQTVAALAAGDEVEPLLRRFELLLLKQAGYGISFDIDGRSGECIHADCLYVYEPDIGFVRTHRSAENSGALPGHQLQAICREDFSHAVTRRYAKQLLRQALQPHLGDKPLRSRTFFRSNIRAQPPW